MILCADEQIAEYIDVCYADSMEPIDHVYLADFKMNYVIKHMFDINGDLQKDGWGIIPVFYRAEIIAVYKGE